MNRVNTVLIEFPDILPGIPEEKTIQYAALRQALLQVYYDDALATENYELAAMIRDYQLQQAVDSINTNLKTKDKVMPGKQFIAIQRKKESRIIEAFRLMWYLALVLFISYYITHLFK